MSGDPRAQWDALSDVVDALLDLDSGARAQRLREIEAGDPAQAAALRDWLRAIEASDGLLDAAPPAAPAGTGP